MLSALRRIIRHVLDLTKRTADTTTTIDTFSEFQLRDIGLTRDNDSIRARAGDGVAPWQRVVDINSERGQASQNADGSAAPPSLGAIRPPSMACGSLSNEMAPRRNPVHQASPQVYWGLATSPKDAVGTTERSRVDL